MQDFSTNHYIIPIERLKETAENAIKNGYNAIICINGEYYDIDITRKETNHNERK